MQKINLENIPSREIVPGYHVRFVHSENMTFAYWDIKADAILPEHSHHHEQVSSMISGEFEIKVSDETKVLKPGSVLIIPANATHSGRAITDCKLIDTFYPIREDYK